MDEPDKSNRYRPADVMRARRPELFSDSMATSEAEISREAFELQLEYLTSKKLELDFENLCRRLAEKEICPNLIPQTGPTGGGDSKVDTETYPVAEEIAARWYEGSQPAATERWGFAFSAKKKWRPKAKSDIEAIAKTGREYTRLFFITSQFVKDKDRTTVEAELKTSTGIDVRVLDRNWILKCVFENGRLPIAIDALHLTKNLRPGKSVGPRDAAREVELKELENQIVDTNRYLGVQYQLAEDCLRAALLTRGLEHPRAEIEGKFDRAARIAEQVGNRQQLMRVAYNRAWTAFWWFNDRDSLWLHYKKVAEHTLKSDNANDLEQLSNLWMLLRVAVKRDGFKAPDLALETRTAELVSALESLSKDSSRRNNALWAKTNLAFVNLHEAEGSPAKLAIVFTELREIVAQSKGLVSYPMDAVIDIAEELGQHFTENPEFDALFETVVETAQARNSDGAAGRILLKRGFQMQGSNKPYEAIRFFGRAQAKLGLRELRGELVAALAGSGQAYSSVGLYWAARAKFLAAANQALSEFSEHGKILPQTLVCLKRLVWAELQLGRVPCILRWMTVTSMIGQQLSLDESKAKALSEELTHQDRVLGILVLKSKLEDLSRLGFLPFHLEHQGLLNSWMALVYALGYEDELKAQSVIPANETPDQVRTFFLQWLSQPAAEEMPARPEYYLDATSAHSSTVIGCKILVEGTNDYHSIFLAERILASLEALLATSLDRDVMAHCAEFKIRLLATANEMPEPKVDFSDKEALPLVTVQYESSPKSIESKGPEWLTTLLIGILARIAFIKDFDKYAQRVFGDEEAIARALNFSESAIPVGNILGQNPQLRMPDIRTGTESPIFPLKRASSWDAGHTGPAAKPRMPGKPGKGPVPPELRDESKWKHTDRKVASVINIPLWDKAGWQATGYLIANDRPPVIAISFNDAAAGRQIFEHWRASFGKIDENEKIRLSIIGGINRAFPFHYRVSIGSKIEIEDEKPVNMISRINQMSPDNSVNLDNFKRAFKAIGDYYFLVPAKFSGPTFSFDDLFLDLSIGKRVIEFRDAWQIAENDPDLMALRKGDDPIIPNGISDPPVRQALKKIRKIGGAG